MTPGNLWRSVRADLGHHWRNLFAGGLGITVSIAALVFFFALGLGLRSMIAGPDDDRERIEVHRPSTDLNLLALSIELGGDTLDDDTLSSLASIDGVRAVHPKMRLLVPALARGGESLLGSAMQTELVADGLAPAAVAGTVGAAFHDPMVAAVDTGTPCRDDTACPDDTVCVQRGPAVSGVCREPIPVLVSEHLVELYNGAFRRAYDLPKVNPNALLGLGLEVSFGASSLRPTGGRVQTERVVFAGTSDAAIPLGITMPLGFVRRLNRELGPRGAGEGFHSALIDVESPADTAGVMAAVDDLGLEVLGRGNERAAMLTAVFLAVVGLVGLVVLGVSGVHVMHVFALLVMIRRREIGVMRALGASRSEIRALLLTEAAVVGAAAGGLGLVLSALAIVTIDGALGSLVAELPFRPETFFALEPWLVAAALGLATVAGVTGALIPVARATRPDPADVIGNG